MTTLTADAIRAMPAGAELDRLVAEACWPKEMPFLPPFSTTWGAAMFAAEKFGLFKDSPPFYVLKCSMGQWMVVPLAYFEEHGCALSVDNQGPACISRAIVMVASERQQASPATEVC